MNDNWQDSIKDSHEAVVALYETKDFADVIFILGNDKEVCFFLLFKCCV